MYSLVIYHIAIEHDNMTFFLSIVDGIFPSNMVIFHSYVKLPEGNLLSPQSESVLIPGP